MIEKIGNVTLDYSKYPGQDFYCDGQIEDELLSILQSTDESEYMRVIGERKSWPVLYHLSPLRENIVDWIPMTGQEKVLEVGSGCGAVTGAFARKAGQVTCVDLSKKRSLINAHRHKDLNNVTIHVGNFKDIEPELSADYDYICLIGVFEYGQSYIGGETPYEDFLKILMRHLAPGGRIVIAIENKYGMKYFAGCKEDHLGSYFAGIENYPEGGGVRTFGRKGLEQIFRDCGIREHHFYYPYPDYKFMTALYSDERLPKRGELSNNLRNFDRDRMLLFREKDAFDGVLEEGLFDVFSNSYIAVLGEELPVKYAKYSNDRQPCYRIRTQMEKTKDGELTVVKYPLSKEAQSHVEHMHKAYEGLCERYEGSGLSVNRCTVRDGAAVFEYVPGVLLSELLDGCLDRADARGFLELFREFVKRTGYNEECPVADFDLIFSNLLVSGENWTLIDYEWTFPEKIPARELAYRALYCYILEDPNRCTLLFDGIMEEILKELSVSEEEEAAWKEKEVRFQKKVTGGERSMAQIRDDIGYKMTKPQEWIDRYGDSADVNRVQIYEDRGQGYSEERSYFVKEAYQGEHLIDFTLQIPGDVKNLRIDPSMDACVVKVLSVKWNGREVSCANRRLMVANGRVCQAKQAQQPSIVFATKDPNINLRLERLGSEHENCLQVKLEIVRLSEVMAADLEKKNGIPG